jgi:hypothetical protein
VAKTKSKNPPKNVACATCGAVFLNTKPGRFEVPSLFDPTVYLCSEPCHLKWAETHDTSEPEVNNSATAAEGPQLPGIG